MSRLSDVRTALYESLSTVFVEPVGILTFSGDRVHQYPPSQPVTPCVWIEQPSGVAAVTGTATVLDSTTFPVAVVVDGADRAQVAALDELVARVWDAAARTPRATPTGFAPGPIDVGGPTLRACLVDVEVVVSARTLCPVPAPTRTEEVA